MIDGKLEAMYAHRYIIAPDCPNCGQKDELNQWKGARRGSTSWGHDYMCCSEECGKAFFESPKYFEMEKQKLRDRISNLEHMLQQIRMREQAARRKKKEA